MYIVLYMRREVTSVGLSYLIFIFSIKKTKRKLLALLYILDLESKFLVSFFSLLIFLSP